VLPRSRSSQAVALLFAVAAVVAATAAFRVGLRLSNPTIAALTYLLIILVTATTSPLWVAMASSIFADVCLNYFFMPPLGTFVIADPQNWVALFTFVAVTLVASHLSSAARDRAREATGRRDELARLFDLSRDVLLITDSREAITHLARLIARRFELDFAAVCLPRGSAWDIFDAGSLALSLEERQLSQALAGAGRGLEFDARERTSAGHVVVDVGGRDVRLVPLRLGTKPVGLLAAAGRPMEPGTLDALAGVAAIAIERTQFLEERKAAELARQSEELKSALLASLGHDLRTPLTAIRLAASNLQASWLAETDRREQSDLILAEVERLSRLFHNILEMARIDAGALAAELRWVHPAEILEAARDQVQHALRQHRLDVETESDRLVRLDPRLTAAALAHLLENAAQYTPPGSPIGVQASVAPDGLTLRVSDRGPGIAPPDLPHLFDRFYRGAEAARRASGTGMGLSIARGMLAAERGRIWVENRADGGAQFTILVPAESKRITPAHDAS
jgi:two-component system, OmpR family, sensor histidine kinase KdpD